ncbi:hypothetical protein GCM10023238_10380 [Streptomyces heliomycini]
MVMIVAGAFYSEQLMQFIAEPVQKCEDLANSSTCGNCAIVSFNTLTSPFTTTIKCEPHGRPDRLQPGVALPALAFIAPGLHKHEKKYTYYFVSAAFPLFVGGAYLSYVILPVSIKVLRSLTPGIGQHPSRSTRSRLHHRNGAGLRPGLRLPCCSSC